MNWTMRAPEIGGIHDKAVERALFAPCRALYLRKLFDFHEDLTDYSDRERDQNAHPPGEIVEVEH